MSQLDLPRPAGLSRDFFSLIVAQLGFGFAFSSFFLLPTFLERELGASATEVGLVVGAGSAPVIVLLPLVGHATDRFGRRGFLILGGCLMALAAAAFTRVESIGPLCVGLRVLQAVAFSMNFAAGGALAVDLAPPGRTGQAVGLFGLAFLAMNGVASATVERLAAAFGWDAAFGAAAVSAAICALLSLAVREPAPAEADTSAPRRVTRLGVPLRALCVMAGIGVSLGTMFSFAQLFAAELGITEFSPFFVAYAIGGVTVRVGLGHRLDGWGPARVCRIALAVYACVVAATIELDVIGLVLLGGSLGLTHGIFYPSYSALVLGQAHPRARSRVIAYIQAAFNLGALSSSVLGAVADAFGYPTVFLIAALSAASAWVLHMTDRETPETAAGAAELTGTAPLE